MNLTQVGDGTWIAKRQTDRGAIVVMINRVSGNPPNARYHWEAKTEGHGESKSGEADSFYDACFQVGGAAGCLYDAMT